MTHKPVDSLMEKIDKAISKMEAEINVCEHNTARNSREYLTTKFRCGIVLQII